MVESKNFVIDNVVPLWDDAKAINTDAQVERKIGVEAADVRCKSCGHTWRAHVGDLTMMGGPGTTLFSCPA